MTDNLANKPNAVVASNSDKIAANLRKRHAAERRFQWYGRISIGFGMLCVLFLFTDIISKGIGAFTSN